MFLDVIRLQDKDFSEPRVLVSRVDLNLLTDTFNVLPTTRLSKQRAKMNFRGANDAEEDLKKYLEHIGSKETLYTSKNSIVKLDTADADFILIPSDCPSEDIKYFNDINSCLKIKFYSKILKNK